MREGLFNLTSYEKKNTADAICRRVHCFDYCSSSAGLFGCGSGKHVGETATVTDRVDGVHQSSKGNIFLNMGGKYSNQGFTAFIPSSSAAQFSQPQQYEGRTVSVSGKITLYHGKPDIIITSPSLHGSHSAFGSIGNSTIAITNVPTIVSRFFFMFSFPHCTS
jgi:hypothetical protein